MTKKALFILLVVLAIGVGLYPGIYLVVDRRFGLLSSKTPELLADPFWNIGFYTHIMLGGIALLIGWTQFSTKLRKRNLTLHKQIGKVYLSAVMLSAPAGIGIAFFATGGWISSLGFICLGSIWFYTTLKGYVYIRNKQIEKHQKIMIYSYAACFAAVTLRLWLPLLIMMCGDFVKAYRIVAWLCWIPNIIVAGLITRRVAKTTNV